MRVNMLVLTTLSSAALVLAGCASTTNGMADAPAVVAGAALADGQGASKGDLTISKVDGGLRLTLRASGISPGVHGVHIHMVGSCVAPAFTSAGGHWNPLGKQHGMQNPAGPHEGDLPNIEIGADGTGTLTATIPATLSDGANPMLDADGASIVIHAGPDDMKTDPSGNSGGRIACGVITQR
ncbi:superoxide dismutase family protein [Sphingobium sp. DEHP117]|uniref:superoxide dismutase family protein n=1 Tax=Sphingobium sp. DEHP117 TaxID=2993436 RepID=UPI0027D4848F|nr:superoxide dismutase family protein [Sphingobium sp. DEHP117]MDQ4420532.1 superoxide dismutase family protein [Sphingobium sp. DEHP117]